MTDPDLRTLRQDDRLLDRIGRGEPVDGGEVEAMLGAWRDTLPVAGPPDPRLVAAVTTRRAKPRRRVVRASLGVAASVALLAGGVMVGATYVNPQSPLWPVTDFVYGGVADSQDALDDGNQAVADARTAAEHGRYAEAGRLLKTADELAGKVADPDEAKRLRDDIADVRTKLPRTPGTTSGSATVHRPAANAPAPPAERDTPAPGHGPSARPPAPGNPGNPGNGPANGPEQGNGPDHSRGGEGDDDQEDGQGAPPGLQQAPKPHGKANKPHHEAPPAG